MQILAGLLNQTFYLIMMCMSELKEKVGDWLLQSRYRVKAMMLYVLLCCWPSKSCKTDSGITQINEKWPHNVLKHILKSKHVAQTLWYSFWTNTLIESTSVWSWEVWIKQLVFGTTGMPQINMDQQLLVTRHSKLLDTNKKLPAGFWEKY